MNVSSPTDVAYLALLVACGATDDEVDALMERANGEMIPMSPYLLVRHARTLIASYRLDTGNPDTT